MFYIGWIGHFDPAQSLTQHTDTQPEEIRFLPAKRVTIYPNILIMYLIKVINQIWPWIEKNGQIKLHSRWVGEGWGYGLLSLAYNFLNQINQV